MVEFHDMSWTEHCDGIAGLSVMNRLLDQGADKGVEKRHVVSDDSPTIWIKDTPPIGRTFGRTEPKGTHVSPKRVSG